MTDERTEDSDVPVVEFSEGEAGGAARKGGGLAVEPILIKSRDLTGLSQVGGILDELEDGNIIVADITPLMDRDPGELKQAIDHLKKSVRDLGGQVARISDSRIIATPTLVKLEMRGQG